MAKVKLTNEEPLEKQLWKAADKLRKNIDAAEYKHVVLSLIFLKYISDSFEEHHAKLVELAHNKMIPFVVSCELVEQSNHIHTSTSSVRTVL
ncbi:MAG: type I restriction-modification system subunit M N-terminal domain-containing protein [Methylococcales bacterium]|nr:type I restriction-modification system subunit M N-terminal domain-containing protein [Methylococcales bacterium]